MGMEVGTREASDRLGEMFKELVKHILVLQDDRSVLLDSS